MVRNLLWPTEITETPNIFQRAGRVLHWISTIAAALWATAGLYILFTQTDDALTSGLGVAAGLSAFCFLTGRAFRYVLAGE